MAYADEWLKFTTPDVVPTPSETEPQAMPESMNIEYIHIDVPDGFVPISALTQGLPGNPSMPELPAVPDQSVRAKKPFQYGPDDIFMKAPLYLVEIPNPYASYPTGVKWTISPLLRPRRILLSVLLRAVIMMTSHRLTSCLQLYLMTQTLRIVSGFRIRRITP
jgi:hypothetical protein